MLRAGQASSVGFLVQVCGRRQRAFVPLSAARTSRSCTHTRTHVRTKQVCAPLLLLLLLLWSSRRLWLWRVRRVCVRHELTSAGRVRERRHERQEGGRHLRPRGRQAGLESHR